LYRSGIKYVSNLLDNSGQFLEFTKLSEKFGINCNIIQSLQLRKALPFQWRIKLTDAEVTLNRIPFIPIYNPNTSAYKNLHTITSKELYWILWKHQRPKLNTPAAVLKWNQFFTILNDAWEHIFKTPFYTFKSTFYQCFQYKVIHRTIACRHWLHMLKVIEMPSCQYCNEDDTILHFFIYCPKICDFWNSFMLWWNRLISTSAKIDEIMIIFGVKIDCDNAIMFNYCLIMAKHFIYINRLNNHNSFDLYNFLIFLKNKMSIEYEYYNSKGDLNTFNRTRGLVFDNI